MKDKLQQALNALRLEVDGSIVNHIENIVKEHDRLLIYEERERIAVGMKKEWDRFCDNGAVFTDDEPHKSLLDIVFQKES